MITVKKALALPDTYPLLRLGKLDELLFFDIETTGFSGDYSSLYLIGCTYYAVEDKTWRLIQWFADTKKAERDVLLAFFEFLENFSVLIHFNGDGFDIPYLLKRCAYYNLPYNFSNVISIDIYKKIKPYKQILDLESLKQKSIEGFLGVARKDMFSGGQLIEVYGDYLVSHDQFLYDLLMLHNEDDLKGMPSILPILNYPDFFEHDFIYAGYEVRELSDIFGGREKHLNLVCESPYSIPVPVSCEKEGLAFSAEGCRIEFSIPLLEGSLKYFYPNYKDYYYLVYEDMAIHKSVAEFVDKAARKKATADTCYTQTEGCFLLQLDELWAPCFRRQRKDKYSYVEFRDELFENTDNFVQYTRRLLSHFMRSQKR